MLRLVDDDEDNVSASVEIVAKQIIRECRELKNDESCSSALLSLLKLVSTSLHASMSAPLIGCTRTFTNKSDEIVT